MSRDATVTNWVRHSDFPGAYFRHQERRDGPVLLTESRTADFIEWLLTTGRGPIADVMRDRARWLADKWRRGQSTRKTRRYDVARWLENEIADAWTLRTDQQTKSMVLRQAAMELLAQADTIHVLDISEIARFIYTTY